MNIQEQQNILKLSNVKTVIEYSRIGKSVCTNENFSRLVNVIKNIRYAAKVEILEENLVHIHFTTINRGKEVHRIVFLSGLLLG